MSENKKTTAIEELAQIANTKSGTPTSAQDQMARLLVLKMEKELQAEKDEAERQQNLRLAQLENIRQMLKIQEETQAQCPHVKPNYRPAIGGQRDGRGNYQWICQYCCKQWVNNELPIHLRIPHEMVGGPN